MGRWRTVNALVNSAYEQYVAEGLLI